MLPSVALKFKPSRELCKLQLSLLFTPPHSHLACVCEYIVPVLLDVCSEDLGVANAFLS